MPRTTLTAARVTALRPRKSPYDTRDSKLTCFGVRVLPSGRKRFFIHCQHRGERVWRIVGDANSMSVTDARRRADEMLAAIRRGEDAASLSRRGPLRGRRRDRVRALRAGLEGGNPRGKPGLLAQPDPAVLLGTPGRRHRQPGGPQLVRLAPRCPGCGRSLHAGALRHHAGGGSDGPSSRGFQPLPGHPTLSPEGKGALPVRRRDPPPVRSAVCSCGTKAASSRGRPSSPPDGVPQERDPDAALVRLPGRSSLPARQQDGSPNRLAVRPDTEGPRRDRAKTAGGSFPAPRAGGPSGTSWLDPFWSAIRAEAELCDVRLHDLRHTFASHAVLRGVPLPAVSHLLGHKQPSMTLRYAHVGDRETEAAAERIGADPSRWRWMIVRPTHPADSRSLREHLSVVFRSPVELPAPSAALLYRHILTSLQDVDLGFAGRRADNHAIHRAIAALSPGDALETRVTEQGRWGVDGRCGLGGGTTCPELRASARDAIAAPLKCSLSSVGVARRRIPSTATASGLMPGRWWCRSSYSSHSKKQFAKIHLTSTGIVTEPTPLWSCGSQ